MRRWLAAVAAATTSVVILAFLIPLALVIRSIPPARAFKAAELEVEPLAPLLGTAGGEVGLDLVVERLNSATPESVTIFLPDGAMIGVPAPADAHVQAGLAGLAQRVVAPGGAELIIPVIRPGGGIAVIRVFIPDSLIHRGVVRAWALLAALGIALLVLAVVLADALARAVLGPLAAVVRVARQLEGGDLAARLVPAGPDEVAAVGRALNSLGARIGELVDAEREAVADLSHRLRTPVMVLGLEAESLRDPAEADRMAASVEVMARTVDEVIEAARRPTRVKVDQTCDVVAVVAERMWFWAVLAEDQERRFQLQLPPAPLWAAVGGDELGAAIDALLGNVFVHTPETTSFTVTVEAVSGCARVVVADEGPGIPDESLIARGSSGARSSGLGLDIAARTAEGSGGRLTISPGGPGARVVLDLGLAREATSPSVRD